MTSRRLRVRVSVRPVDVGPLSTDEASKLMLNHLHRIESNLELDVRTGAKVDIVTILRS